MEDNKKEQVLELLRNATAPIKGHELAESLEVSRQAIVQYIAIIRASGINVIATRLGYMIPKLPEHEDSIKTIYSTHRNEAIQEELEIIVDMGGTVLDVIVEHPVYGEIICPLNIKSRYDISNFVAQLEKYSAKPLSILTGGEHRHTIEVPNEEVYALIIKKLKEKSFIE
ncbi:MAG: transcription repressor NadR [Clostridia bacterium]|nr:transcription repressor NadR [Clostridia bacterium]